MRIGLERAALLDDTGLRGPAFCRAWSGLADEWLAWVFDRALGDRALGDRALGDRALGDRALGDRALGDRALGDRALGDRALGDRALGDRALGDTVGHSSGLALIARGGYGRGELAPGSDIDVALVAGRRRNPAELARTANAVWLPVWDAGIKLGNSVWSVKEALRLAASDLDTATSLLDVRVVAGDPGVGATLAERAAAQWRSKASYWLGVMARSVQDRHEDRGEVAFLLEPDIKSGRGGLRDAHSLAWAVATGRLAPEWDVDAMQEAYGVLLEVRVELHRRTGKPTDRLVLQEQDGVADALGYADADALMAAVAGAARTIAWTSDGAWRSVATSLGSRGARPAPVDRPLGPGLVLREGAVELGPGADPAADPALVLRAAAAAAAAGAQLSRAALDRLAAEAAMPGDPWPDEARRALLRLLGTGRPAIGVLEALDQNGLLVRLVPEWAAVRCRPQRNAYHRFTVDRHLCEAAAEAAGLAARVHRPDLLVAAAWLHDLGKGFTGEVATADHTDAGVVVVERVAARLGFPPEDVAVLVDLVRYHLLLPDMATRRDVGDPATVAAVAGAVGSRETLSLLHALTEADSLATGPAAWSRWKAELVGQLVCAAAGALSGELPDPAGASAPAGHAELVARVVGGEDPVVEGWRNQVTVAATDRRGLFCRVAGTLAVHNLDVLSARGWSSPEGVALEDFEVEPAFGGEPDWSAVGASVVEALADRLPIEARLAEQAQAYGAGSRSQAATPARTKVLVDNDASAVATVVEVWVPDHRGALYRITRTLAELGLDIRHAKVATLGHEVVDSFYVVDSSGAKVLDGGQVAAIHHALAEQLARL